jgi:hypothetical protein
LRAAGGSVACHGVTALHCTALVSAPRSRAFAFAVPRFAPEQLERLRNHRKRKGKLYRQLQDYATPLLAIGVFLSVCGLVALRGHSNFHKEATLSVKAQLQQVTQDRDELRVRRQPGCPARGVAHASAWSLVGVQGPKSGGKQQGFRPLPCEALRPAPRLFE